jgi:hypothetical protein
LHRTRCNYDDGYRHILCEKPHVLFLESETPSEAARTGSA